MTTAKPRDNEIPWLRNSRSNEIFSDYRRASTEAHVFCISWQWNVFGQRSALMKFAVNTVRMLSIHLRLTVSKKCSNAFFAHSNCVNFSHDVLAWAPPILVYKKTVQQVTVEAASQGYHQGATHSDSRHGFGLGYASRLPPYHMNACIFIRSLCQPKNRSFYRYKIRQSSLPKSGAQVEEGRIALTILEPPAAHSLPLWKAMPPLFKGAVKKNICLFYSKD